MQTANCWLQIEKTGSDVQILDVTPAELVLLANQFQPKLGKFPVHDLVVSEEPVERNSLEEIERLRNKYGFIRGSRPPKFKVDDLYPGVNPHLPETFAETNLLVQSQLSLIPR